jgi:hypothetical protein
MSPLESRRGYEHLRSQVHSFQVDNGTNSHLRNRERDTPLSVAKEDRTIPNKSHSKLYHLIVLTGRTTWATEASIKVDRQHWKDSNAGRPRSRGVADCALRAVPMDLYFCTISAFICYTSRH